MRARTAGSMMMRLKRMVMMPIVVLRKEVDDANAGHTLRTR